ncbi:MAG: sialidase family protein [Terriglobales bacterium]
MPSSETFVVDSSCTMRFMLVIAFFAATALAQIPPAPGAHVIQLTPVAGFQNEPSIAINPRNPRQLVLAYQSNIAAAYSRDAGRTWTLASGVSPTDYSVSGDVSITYDTRGHAILCFIAFDKLGTDQYWGHNATRNGVFIRRSLDGGATWEGDAIPVLAYPTRAGIPFEDKPYILADNSHGRYAGNLYVGWTEFSLTKSIILFSRSTDGGLTWSHPAKISSHDGLPRDDNGSVEGFTGTVTPDGTLYVVWADGNDIAFTYSHDGGRRFARSRSIIKTAPPYFQVSGVSRANGFPQIGYGPAPARGRGKPGKQSKAGLLYVTWSDYRNGDVDVFCATSADGGRSWGRPVRVNSDAVHSGADQFLQWLAVDPATGAVNVIFYDRRSDPANRKTTIVLARSTDDGKTFTNYAWTSPQQAFETSDEFLGDYTAIAALGGRVYGVWAEVERPLPPPALSPAPGSSPAPPALVAGEAAVSATRPHRTVIWIGSAEFPQ